MSNYGLGNISALWAQRVLKEKEDLDIKIEKLESFMKKAPSDLTISNHVLYLLSEQLVVMKRYSYLLGERLRVGAKNYEDQAQSD